MRGWVPQCREAAGEILAVAGRSGTQQAATGYPDAVSTQRLSFWWPPSEGAPSVALHSIC